MEDSAMNRKETMSNGLQNAGASDKELMIGNLGWVTESSRRN